MPLGHLGARSPPSGVLLNPFRPRRLDFIGILSLGSLRRLREIPSERTRNAQVIGSSPIAGSSPSWSCWIDLPYPSTLAGSVLTDCGPNFLWGKRHVQMAHS